MKNKGITLIALVVTIVVLLILVSISIGALTGDNGILNQAQNAKDKNKESEVIEKVKLAIMGNIDEEGINISALEEELNKLEGIETKLENLTIDSFPLQITVDNVKLDVFLNGKVDLASDMTQSAYVMIYDNGTKTQDGINDAYEMVFQRGNNIDETKKLIASYTNFENLGENNRPWDEFAKNIEVIKFIDIIKPIKTLEWFAGFENCKEINGLEKLDTRECTNMQGLFYSCKILKNLETEYLNTKNCSNFSWMFQNCTSLQNLDLSNWNMEKGGQFQGMFQDCTSLTSINLGNWYPKESSNCYYMFGGCTVLKSLGNMENWNTENITDFSYMFYNCKSLKSVNVKNWNTSKGENFSNMFNGCISMEELDITNWDTSSSMNMSNIFYNMKELTKITVGNKFNKLGNGTSWSDFPQGIWKNTSGIEFDYTMIPNLIADIYTKVQ